MTLVTFTDTGSGQPVEIDTAEGSLAGIHRGAGGCSVVEIVTASDTGRVRRLYHLREAPDEVRRILAQAGLG